MLCRIDEQHAGSEHEIEEAVSKPRGSVEHSFEVVGEWVRYSVWREWDQRPFFISGYSETIPRIGVGWSETIGLD